MNLTGEITIDRVLLVVFVAGTLFERFRGYGRSLREQGKRIGALENAVAKINGLT